MSDDSSEINQDEIEALLRQVQETSKEAEKAPQREAAEAAHADAGAEEPASQPEEIAAGDAVAADEAAEDGGAKLIDQSEIEALLGNAPSASSKRQAAYTPQDPGMEVSPEELKTLLAEGENRSKDQPRTFHKGSQATVPPPKGGGAAKKTAKAAVTNDIDLLLQQTQEALDSIEAPVEHQLEGISPFSLEEFRGSPASPDYATLDLLRDVELDLKIELGRTHMPLEEVLKLSRGAVVPLDKLAGDPVDVYVNGRLVARGEVLVLNDNFCVRVAELVSGNQVD